MRGSPRSGHAGNGGDASFAFNHPEKLVDFAYRAVHEMTARAKLVIEKHYKGAADTNDAASFACKAPIADVMNYVLYDGACGFCSRWVPSWAKTLRQAGFEIAPLQSPWLATLARLNPAELTDDFTLLLDDGRLLKGADAYRFVMRRIWWAVPLYALSVIPVLHGIFDWSYRTFARNRYCVSRTLGLAGSEERRK